MQKFTMVLTLTFDGYCDDSDLLDAGEEIRLQLLEDFPTLSGDFNDVTVETVGG